MPFYDSSGQKEHQRHGVLTTDCERKRYPGRCNCVYILEQRVSSSSFRLIVGFAIGIVYGQVRLQSLDKVYQAKIKEMNQRLAQTQRKYSQGVTAQNDLEQQKMSIQEEVDKLAKEKGVLRCPTVRSEIQNRCT